jgi:multidrug efflux pump subunit AcrA (membrane-fusion protein)
MASFFKRHLAKLLLIPIVAVGAIGFRLLAGSRESPELKPPEERGAAVRFVTVEALDVIPRAVAYGAVRPQKTWRAVAEVSGRIVAQHSRLRAGTFVKQGDLLFSIDPAEYEIEVVRSEANVETLTSRLSELDLQKRQFEALLVLERKQLALVQRELDRLVELLAAGSASQSEQEQQSRVVLDSETRVLSLEQSIELHPTQRAALEKQRAAEVAKLELAKLDVARCRITAPFDGRVESVDAEQEQVIAAGQTLCALDAIDIAEVAAPFGLARLAGLRLGRRKITFEELASDDAFRKVLKVTATVRLSAPGRTLEWPARLLRLEAVNADTRAMPFVVGVDGPYDGAIPGVRPPLIRGLYVAVELRGEAQPARIVVPRSALRQDGTLPMADDENRLRFAPVVVAYTQGLMVVITSGVEPGARVVVSDVIPAVDGMRLRPVPDHDIEARLRAAAAGQGDVR